MVESLGICMTNSQDMVACKLLITGRDSLFQILHSLILETPLIASNPTQHILHEK